MSCLVSEKKLNIFDQLFVIIKDEWDNRNSVVCDAILAIGKHQYEILLKEYCEDIV